MQQEQKFQIYSLHFILVAFKKKKFQLVQNELKCRKKLLNFQYLSLINIVSFHQITMQFR